MAAARKRPCAFCCIAQITSRCEISAVSREERPDQPAHPRMTDRRPIMAVQALNVPAYTIRRLWPVDRDAVLDYFLRLHPDTAGSRFMGNVSEAGVRAYAAQAVHSEGVMYGAFMDGALRGLGELRPMGPCPSRYTLSPRAEAAFAVERAFRRRGIGAALFARIARSARHRGV